LQASIPCLLFVGRFERFDMRKFVLAAGVVALSGSLLVAGPLGNIRKRAEERRESRHVERAEVVVGKDGKPALRWADGTVSPIGKDKKTGELIAAPKAEAPKTIHQKHGPEIKLVPGVRVN
jgi:hypothetical protein